MRRGRRSRTRSFGTASPATSHRPCPRKASRESSRARHRLSGPITGWSSRSSSPAPAIAPDARRTLEGGKLDADAGAVGIDVGLARRDAEPGHPAPSGDDVVDRPCQRFLQVEPPPFDKTPDFCAKEIVIPGGRFVILGGEGGFVDPYFDGDEQSLRRPYLERSEEHTSELQSLMRISYAVF